jgi:hypothetical protein
MKVFHWLLVGIIGFVGRVGPTRNFQHVSSLASPPNDMASLLTDSFHLFTRLSRESSIAACILPLSQTLVRDRGEVGEAGSFDGYKSSREP